MISVLISTGLGWAQKVEVFKDWEVWNTGTCYILTKGTSGDFLYRNFGKGKRLEFTIYDKKQLFKPSAKFSILIDSDSEVSMYSHPSPKSPRERSYLWSHPADDKQLDRLFKKGTTVALHSRKLNTSVFSLEGYPDAARLMDNNCIAPKLKVLHSLIYFELKDSEGSEFIQPSYL